MLNMNGSSFMQTFDNQAYRKSFKEDLNFSIFHSFAYYCSAE